MRKIIAFVFALILCFSGCSNQEKSEVKLLSSEEIEFFNEMFYPQYFDEETNSYKTNLINGFFLSYYDDVRNMNFSEFLKYFPAEEVTDEKEFEALIKVEVWGFNNVKTLENMPVPVRRISAEKVDEVLKEYAEIKAKDLDTSAVPYLKKYKAYYNSTSDYGPGMFICISGEKEGDMIYLYSENAKLTLIEKDGKYKIIAHQRTSIY
ncbi:MAG: hypothetical protein IKU42_02810 [Oscillospiraceae bacterium]|nr:hypothetical protein [Oscillospiraceae bacterium]